MYLARNVFMCVGVTQALVGERRLITRVGTHFSTLTRMFSVSSLITVPVLAITEEQCS